MLNDAVAFLKNCREWSEMRTNRYLPKAVFMLLFTWATASPVLGASPGNAPLGNSDGLEAAEQPVRVTVTPEELVSEPINPMIYGNFIESGFGRQVDGMWSEMLFNRSFEEVTPLKESVWGWLNRKPEDDLAAEDWWHSGYEEPQWYVAPGNPEAHLNYSEYWDFHHGLRAASLNNRNNTSKATLAQDGLCLRPGITYRFSGYLRHGEIADRDVPPIDVTVGLYKEAQTGDSLVSGTLRGVAGPWQRYECELANGGFEGRATLGITVPPGANVSLDGLSLMPLDHVHGWRRDVAGALKRVRPRILRWPGGCYASFYHWRDGIGPAHERRPRESTYWGGLENNDVGTAEFVSLCREIGAEPFICANVMTGSPAEAAEWVAYCNASAEHPMGALRAQQGYPEPFGVTYWELDNETYREYGALEYAQRCAEFAQAMKAAGPGIKLVMVGYWRFHAFLPEMLEIAGPHIDFVTDRELDEGYLRGVLETLRAYNAKSGRNIRLCNTEWLAPSEDVPVALDAAEQASGGLKATLQNRQIRWRYAMNAAKQLLVFQRLGGEFVFANFNNLANTWGQNVIECPKEGCYLSATGRVFELFSACPAAWPLRLESGVADSGVVTQAAWDAPRERLILIALNYRREKTEILWDLSQLPIDAAGATVTVLSAPSAASFNTLENPDAVEKSEKKAKLAGHTMSFTLPPNSVVMAVIG